MESRGLFDFEGSENEELSFKRGATLKILNTEIDPNWYRAEYNGREGLVPKNYIQMTEECPWYIPNISRSDAEDKLKSQSHDGAFFVRNSESSPGDFSISVKFQKNVQHFKILRDGAGKYFLWLVKFDSINALVNHHRKNSVSKDQQILLQDPILNADQIKCTVKAKFDFTAQDGGELSMSKGDVVEVLDQTDQNWWTGRNITTNKEGLFPVPYVEMQK